MERALKNKLIKLAYENPELREDLLNLLTKEAGNGIQFPGKSLTTLEDSSGPSGGSSPKDLLDRSNNISFAVSQIKQLDHTNSEIDGVMICKSGTRVNGTIPWKVKVSLGAAFYSNMEVGNSGVIGSGFFKHHSGEAAFRIFKALEKQFPEVMDRHGDYSALDELKESIGKYLSWVLQLNPETFKGHSGVVVLPAKPANRLTD
jgi:hypothetical protein